MSGYLYKEKENELKGVKGHWEGRVLGQEVLQEKEGSERQRAHSNVPFSTVLVFSVPPLLCPSLFLTRLFQR